MLRHKVLDRISISLSGYKGETDDRAQAMAVVSGLASADKYPALVKVLKKECHASPYMEKYVLEALFQMNEPAFALERMKQRYAKMMDYPEYTTLFEGWGIGPDGFGGGTINPCMEWWPSYVAESESVRYRTYLSRFSFLQGLSPNGHFDRSLCYSRYAFRQDRGVAETQR